MFPAVHLLMVVEPKLGGAVETADVATEHIGTLIGRNNATLEARMLSRMSVYSGLADETPED